MYGGIHLHMHGADFHILLDSAINQLICIGNIYPELSNILNGHCARSNNCANSFENEEFLELTKDNACQNYCSTMFHWPTCLERKPLDILTSTST